MKIGNKRLILLWLLICVSVAYAAGPWRANEGNTSGWALMTPKERLEHQTTVRSFANLADCRAYQRLHHAQMEDRARASGQTLKLNHRDICEHLRPPNTPP